MVSLKSTLVVGFGCLLVILCGVFVSFTTKTPLGLHKWTLEAGEQQLQRIGDSGVKVAWKTLSYASLEHNRERSLHNTMVSHINASDALYEKRQELLREVARKLEWLANSMGGGSKHHKDRINSGSARHKKLRKNENDPQFSTRPLNPAEKGNNILITMRTVKTFHDSRFPVLFSTWLTKVNRSNVFITADDMDSYWLTRLKENGIRYIQYSCTSPSRADRLCCQMGTELAQIFVKGNEHYDWVCHIDDDMYVRIPPLVKLLSQFDGKKDRIYLGRLAVDTPMIVSEHSRIGSKKKFFHFATGGMICLSRAMLELSRPYFIGGQTYSETCEKTMEPDDVTMGLVMETVLNVKMTNTEEIYTHNLALDTYVKPDILDKHVAFSYGYGTDHWRKGKYNAISVPGALYSLEEDKSQFKSLHCYLYPDEPQCLQRLETRNHILVASKRS